MERFYDQDPENENYYFDEEEEYAEISQDSIDEHLINVFHVGIAQMELNQHMLTKSVEIAEKDIFWRFRSELTKINKIEMIYNGLCKIFGYNVIEEEEV